MTHIADMSMEELEAMNRRFLYNCLLKARQLLEADGCRHSWLDPAVAIARGLQMPPPEKEIFYHDYPNEAIGNGNPYWRCASCKVSDPAINGKLENHEPTCAYRLRKERELKKGQ